MTTKEKEIIELIFKDRNFGYTVQKRTEERWSAKEAALAVIPGFEEIAPKSGDWKWTIISLFDSIEAAEAAIEILNKINPSAKYRIV